MRSKVLHAALLAAAVTGAPAGVFAADAANTIRYGIDDATNFSRLPQVVAERKGYFAREGLTVEIVPFTNSFRNGGANSRPITLREGMRNGSVDMARQQFPLLVNDVLAGARTIAVSTVASNPIYFLLARPEIKSFADLKGKTVIATNPTDGITLWTRKLLALHGLHDGDFKLTSVAGNDGRIVCMKAKMCDAGTVPQPTVFDGLRAGFHVLGVISETGAPLLQVDIANADWAAAHRALLTKYIRATTAAVQFIADPKNGAEVERIAVDYMKQPPNVVRDMLANVRTAKAPAFPKQTGLAMNEVRAALAILAEYGTVPRPAPPPERFADASYGTGAGQ
jgi:ABC-type nitrate/sulfonate/bicarbonate transport system substrate-binding protein